MLAGGSGSVARVIFTTAGLQGGRTTWRSTGTSCSTSDGQMARARGDRRRSNSPVGIAFTGEPPARLDHLGAAGAAPTT